MKQKKASEYIQVENSLKNSLNGKLNKKNAGVFLNSIKILKDEFNIRISTKFLRGLINPIPSRLKTYRISYFLKESGLKTKREMRTGFKEWVLNAYETEIIEYSINKQGLIYIKDIRNQDIGKLTLEEKNEVLHFINI